MAKASARVRSEKKDGTLYCSFCGKSQHEVQRLIAGPAVFICDECADLCMEIVLKGRSEEPEAVGPLMRYVLKISFDKPFNATESSLLPALIQSLEIAYPGCTISIKSFEVRKDGGLLSVFFDSPVKILVPEIKALQSEVENLSRLLKIEQERYLVEKRQRERMEVMYRELTQDVFPLLIDQLRKQGRLVDRNIKTMLIMFADIVGFSSLPNDDRTQKLDLLRVIARSLLKTEHGLYLNTWGDGLIAAFDDPNQGLRCACKFVQHLNVDGIDVRVGVSWGAARITYNDITERMDIDGTSVNVGARLEPLASPGEVIASELVYSLPELRREDFSFLEREVELRKGVGDRKEGDKIKVFRVSYLPNR